MVVFLQTNYLDLKKIEMDIIYILNIKLKKWVVFVQVIFHIHFTWQKC